MGPVADPSEGPADDERRAWLWRRVRALAEADDVPVGLRHVCATAATTLDATDVVVYQVVDGANCEPVCVAGPRGDRLSEAEITFGEGPAIECLHEEYPVLAADLASGAGAASWPFYAPFAVSRGVAAVFAFPVMMGAIVVGCLEVHRPEAGMLTEVQLVDGLLLADAVMLLLLRSGPVPVGADPSTDAVDARWAAVHQAAGVASGQLDCDPATALVRLRAHAYRTGQRLADVAADVLTGRLRFRPDHPDGGSEPSPEPEQD